MGLADFLRGARPLPNPPDVGAGVDEWGITTPRAAELGFFRPARLPGGPYRAALDGRGARTPEESWERLAALGLIPHGWVDDPRRRFAHDHSLSREGYFDVAAAAPRDPRLAVALAADVAGVERVEDLAFMLERALSRWTPHSPDRKVAWRLAHPAMERHALRASDPLRHFGRWLNNDAPEDFVEEANRRRALVPAANGASSPFVNADAAEQGALAINMVYFQAHLWQQAQGPRHDFNPFAAHLEIWASGYQFEGQKSFNEGPLTSIFLTLVTREYPPAEG